MSAPNYGARLRAARAFRDMTQAQLAEKMDVSQACIAQWEEHGSMRMREIPRLAQVLGVSEDYLQCHGDCMEAVEEFVTAKRTEATKRKPLRAAQAHANRKRGKK